MVRPSRSEHAQAQRAADRVEPLDAELGDSQS
jgi:hypothetical protein